MRRAAGRDGVLRRRGCLRTALEVAAVRVGAILGLLGFLAGCGGSGATSTSTGGIALRITWEQASHNGNAVAPGVQPQPPIPPSVSTVEVRVNTTGGQTVRSLVNPNATADVVIQNLRTGPATVQVFGYDLAFADNSLLNDFNLPPSYASAALSVVIPAGHTADVGTITALAQPFVTDFDPGLGVSGVSLSATVSFVVATAVGDIVQTTIDISIAGVAVVSNGEMEPGVTLHACDDGGEVPCGTSSDRMLKGFRFSFRSPLPYAPEHVTNVVVSAGDTNLPQRSFHAFQYFFTTGLVVVTATPTVTPTSTATLTPTPTPTLTRTLTPPPLTLTPTLTPTSTRSRTPTRTRTATTTPTVTATSTPSDTPTPQPMRYVVTTTADDGPGSLRQAMLDANTDLQPSVIEFDPMLAGDTISVIQDDLPAIEESDTTINGDIDGDGRPDIQLDGPGLDFAFDVFGDRTILQGLSMSSFEVGMVIEVEASNALIDHCYVGVALDGISDAHNFDTGIEVHGSAHRISNSVISANLGFAFDIAEDASGVILTTNIVGASVDRTVSLGNGDDAIAISDSGDHIIGGPGPNDGNFIVSNTGSGVAIIGFEGHARNITVQGNQIGDPNLRGNVEGVSVVDASDILIGGSAPGAANVIQANDGPGVSIQGETSIGVKVSRNSEAANGDPGIVRLDGAETLVSPPVIQLDGQTIIGTGAPNSTIEIFATDEPPDPTGAGEGQTFLGSVMSDQQGAFSFPLTQPGGVPALPTHVTATLTDAMGNTSIYAQNIDVAATPTPTDTATPEETPNPIPAETPTETVVLTPIATTTQAPTPGETPTPTRSEPLTATVTATPTPTVAEALTPTALPTAIAIETLTEPPLPG